MTHVLILYEEKNKYDLPTSILFRVWLESQKYTVSVETGMLENYLEIAEEHQPDCLILIWKWEGQFKQDAVIKLLEHYPVILYCVGVIKQLEAFKAHIATTKHLKPFANHYMPMIPQNLYQSVKDVLEG